MCGAAVTIYTAALPPDTWTRLFRWLPFLPRTALAGDKLHKIATLLDDASPETIYRRLVSQWQQPDEICRRRSPTRPRRQLGFHNGWAPVRG